MTTQFRSHGDAWRVASTERLEPGSTVTVTRRNGQASQVIIREQLAHDPSRDLPYLYAFDDVRRASGAQPSTQTRNCTLPEGAANLFALFERAASHNRGAAVRFTLGTTRRGLRIEMAGANSRYAGRLLALSEQRNGRSRTLYGSLTREGVFEGRVGATQVELDIFNEVHMTLVGFANDPAGYAAAHGRSTGNCSFCGRGLTDARSLEVGYGPVCADHYGLPWGSEAPSASDDMLSAAVDFNRPVEAHTIINRTAHGIETSTGERLDGWGRQFGVIRAGQTDDELRAAILQAQRQMSAPTLEDIQNEPNASRRMAMTANRASAGLPSAVHRNAMGQIIPMSAVMETRAIPDPAVEGRVVTTVRRVRPAAPPALITTVNPRPLTTIDRIQQRAAARREQREQRLARERAANGTTPTDETTTTVHRAQRRDQLAPLEEDDFVWPPRNT